MNKQLVNNLIVVISIIIVIGLIWWGAQRQEKVSTQSLHIAALIPLTGNGALDGELISHGLELAQEQLNQETRMPVRLTIEDTKGNSKEAINIYQKLMANDPPQAIITWGSGVGLALTPLVNEDKVLQMGVATSAPDYTTPNDYTLRNFPLASNEADFIITKLKTHLKASKVAIAMINNDYGNGLASQLRHTLAQGSDITITKEVILEPGSNDLRTQISHIKASNPEAVVLFTYPTEGATFLRQAQELGLQVPVIASSAILGNNIIEAAGLGAERVLISNALIAFDSPDNINFQKFLTRYQEKFGKQLGLQDIMALRGFDSLSIFTELLRKCDGDTTCAKDQLLTLHDYPGLNGSISFDNNGDLVDPNFILITVHDGNYESTQ